MRAKHKVVVTSLLVPGGVDFRRQNARREEVDRRLETLGTLPREYPDTNVFLLPAGYFCARGQAAALALARRAHERLQVTRSKATFVYGVDGWLGDKAGLKPDERGYPFFVVVRTPNARAPRVLRQISTSSAEGRRAEVLNGRWRDDRVLAVQGVTIGVLICGEVWSAHLQGKVAAAKPIIVLVPAHRAVNKGRGRRSWKRPINDLVARGATVILAEHTKSGAAHPRVWGRGASVASERDDSQAWVITTTVTATRSS